MFENADSPNWKAQADLVKQKIAQEKTANGQLTGYERDLCVSINITTLRDSEHYVKDGPDSNHFLQTTKARLAVLREAEVHPEAARIVYESYFTAFSSWRSDSLGTADGIKRFFEETKQVGFPKEELERMVVEQITREAIEWKGPAYEMAELKKKPGKIPGFLRAEEIAVGMGISTEDLGVRVMDMVASACEPGDSEEKFKLRESLDLPRRMSKESAVDRTIRVATRMGVSMENILKTMDRVWPIQRLVIDGKN